MLLCAAVATWLLRPREAVRPELPVPGEGETVVVEVLNGTRVDGFARSMTRRLRRAGIDVVYFGSARENNIDSTLLIVRRGDSSVAEPVRDALGGGRTVVEFDPRLLLDVTVLLGHDLALTIDIHP